MLAAPDTFMVNAIFFNQGGLLRAGWRSTFFASLYILSVILLTVLIAPLGGFFADSPRVSVFIRSAVMFLPAIGIGLFCTRFFEGLGPTAFGVASSGSGTNILRGILAGVAALAAAVLPAMALGGLGYQFNSFDALSLLGSLAVFAIAAAWEEALFRGYILQTLTRAGYAWPAILLTAALFGLGHAANPGSTGISTLNTVLAGVWFGAAYLRTRNLWFVWAMHLAWNWAQGSILGIEVSGLTDISGTSLFRENDVGPEWLTGAAYGIEGSVTATAAILISTAAILLIPGKTGHTDLTDLNFEADIDRTGRVGEFSDRN
jgi:membrane protease YdiL (CAAX protease family)